MRHGYIAVVLLISGVVACSERNMDLEKHYDLPYPPAKVYAAWVSSDTVIPPATAMDINPIVGGHFD